MQELLKDRLKTITNQPLLDSVQYLKFGLIAGVRSNQGNLYNEEYLKLRSKLKEFEQIQDAIPDFISLYDNISSCEEYIILQIHDFNEREKFINSKFEKLISKLKNGEVEKTNFKSQTLTKFRELINGDSYEHPLYRSGSDLVALFNQFGFNDEYARGFPSRYTYTDDKLSKMKFEDIKRLMELVLAPINFINKEELLKELIDELNKYLMHDNLMLKKNQNKTLFCSYDENLYSLELDGISEEFIHEIWKKSTSRNKDKDYDGAITSARSLLETIFKYILDNASVKYKDNSELPELYKQVSRYLNLAPGEHHEEIFKQILSGATSIVNGLGSLRNKFGDAHGKTAKTPKIAKDYKPLERHSELAVNMAGSLALFLYRTFKESKAGLI